MIKFTDLPKNLRDELCLLDIEDSLNIPENKDTAFLYYLQKAMLDGGYYSLSEREFNLIQHCYKEKTNDLS
jgi:hypothetical protein